MNLNPPSEKHKLYVVIHEHRHGTSVWALWAEMLPSEEQAVMSLEIDFEPDREEFICIEEIDEIQTLQFS